MANLEARLDEIEAQVIGNKNMLLEIQKQNTVTQTTLRQLLDRLEEETEMEGSSTMDILEDIAEKLEMVAATIQVLAKRK